MGNPRSSFIEILYTKIVHLQLDAPYIDESFDATGNAR
jgi:hypothetical protein